MRYHYIPSVYNKFCYLGRGEKLHSYKYFIAGWVEEYRWKQFKECCLVIGKVSHSYTVTSAPLTPWVIIRNSGAVACGHCTCMAGLGKTCSHIGALLYWLAIEYQVQTIVVLPNQISGLSQTVYDKCHI